MRTTLDIDDDVLIAARGLAAQTDRSIGKVVSELARQALRPSGVASERNGIPLMSAANAPVTLELVNALRDAEP
ncbi:MAG: CopG family transcriptional regulator [Rhizobiaceae bacterium]|jgi:hypothetical protein|nr:CopG family transcriptional regulator [Rhizobiaceae bacterium]